MKVLFAAGGTGGHLVPAINIADYLARNYEGINIFFVSSQRGLTSSLLPEHGFQLLRLDVDPLYREVSRRLFRSLKKLFLSFIKVNLLLNQIKPDVIVGTASYLSGPVLLMGALKGIPTVIQEQNSIPGLTTKLLSLVATRICLAYEESRKYLMKESKALLTGNPIKTDQPSKSLTRLREEYCIDESLQTILVTGGSQGAKNINKNILRLIDEYKINDNYNLLWLTGKDNFAKVDDRLKEQSNIWLAPFTTKMEDLYTLADLVIGRAGALTLSEILYWGRPSILIPYPHATANHQYHNALSIANAGGAILLRDEEVTAKKLYKAINKILEDKELKNSMSKRAKGLSKNNSKQVISREIINLAGKQNV